MELVSSTILEQRSSYDIAGGQDRFWPSTTSGLLYGNQKNGDAEVRQTEILIITSPVVSKQEGFFVGWRLAWGINVMTNVR